jgi:hypothetical protein
VRGLDLPSQVDDGVGAAEHLFQVVARARHSAIGTAPARGTRRATPRSSTPGSGASRRARAKPTFPDAPTITIRMTVRFPARGAGNR